MPAKTQLKDRNMQFSRVTIAEIPNHEKSRAAEGLNSLNNASRKRFFHLCRVTLPEASDSMSWLSRALMPDFLLHPFVVRPKNAAISRHTALPT